MDTITYEVKGVERLIRRLQAASRDAVLIEALDSSTLHLRHWIVTRRLAGRPGLIHRTGTLARSITPVKARRIGDAIEARIGTNLIYAKIHEFGWPPGRLNVRGVDMNIPARPFMGPSLKDRSNRKFILDEIVTGITKAIERQN